MPAFGALVKPLIDRPGNATVDSTPGTLPAMSDMRRITASVRSSEAASGSWAKPIRYCLSWAGTKPLGTTLNMNTAPIASIAYTPSAALLRFRTPLTPVS